jgi:hypothetical protein
MNNPGQRTRLREQIWTMISSVLLQTLNNEANGAVYQMHNGIGQIRMLTWLLP